MTPGLWVDRKDGSQCQILASIGNLVWKLGDSSRVGVDGMGSVSAGINTGQSSMGGKH